MDVGEQVAAVVTALGGGAAIGYGIRYLLEWYFKYRKQIRDERTTAVDEWRHIAHETQRILDQVRIELARCETDRAEGRLETVRLTGEMRLLQSTVQRLQAITGDTMFTSISVAQITADMDGKIKVATGTPALLHYLPHELAGKNVEILIPKRLRQQHKKSLELLKQSQQPPWSEKTLTTFALTREGIEIPVTINLTGWQHEGSWMISAEIKSMPTPPTGFPLAQPITATQP